MNRLPYLESFIDYLNNNKYHKISINSYLTGVSNFDKFLLKNNINFDSLELKNVNNYIDQLGIIFSRATIGVYVVGIKTHLSFLKKYNGFKFNFDIDEIKTPKRIKKIKKEINLEGVLKIINHIKNVGSILSLRDFLLLEIIIKTGIPISELVRLKKENIYKNKIKSENEIEYFIDNQVYDEINKLIEKSVNNSEYLFTPYSHHLKHRNNLTTRSVESMIQKYFKGLRYNDLRLIYYKSLVKELPDINQISHHFNGDPLVDLGSVERII